MRDLVAYGYPLEPTSLGLGLVVPGKGNGSNARPIRNDRLNKQIDYQ